MNYSTSKWIWRHSLFHLVIKSQIKKNKADGIDINRATGECYAHNSLSSIKLIDYDKIWLDPTLDYKYSLDKDKEGVDQDSVWLETVWKFHDIYRQSVERCAKGETDICKKIVEHTEYLASGDKMLKNKYWNKDGHDFYESRYSQSSIPT